MLDSDASTQAAELTHGIAEHETRFDSYGTGRNHDLVLHLRRDDGCKIVVGIEAKVDEPLDCTVLGKIDEAKKILDAGERTNLMLRVEELVLALFGRSLDADTRRGSLRYQLLTAAAGTLVEAKRRDASAAMLVVHDLSLAGHSANVLDTSDFVNAFGGGDGIPLKRGRFYGPLEIAGGGRIPSDIPLSVAVIAAVDR